ncbi:MAG TPA: DUF169 domain-containing protein [Dehalococcoidia bacterium]|nr:DUF169 domain-containing protein [Dehalococcoidia bacterium]
MGKWQDAARDLESLLRLRTFPLAIKFVAKKKELESISRTRQLDHPYTFCQIVSLSRTVGWTIVGTPESLLTGCKHMLGLERAPREWRRMFLGVWFENTEAADAQYDAFQTVPFRGHEAVVVAPLASEKFEPDITLIHGTPAQMHLLMCAFIYKNFERLRFFFLGESSCADTLAEAYNSGKPALSIPCYGQRRYGHVREDELEYAIPPDWIEKGLEGLRWLSSRGIRYPIPHWGAEIDPSPGLAVSHSEYRK